MWGGGAGCELGAPQGAASLGPLVRGNSALDESLSTKKNAREPWSVSTRIALPGARISGKQKAPSQRQFT